MAPVPIRPTAYIAGPMAGLPDHNFPAFDRAAALLDAAGYDPVSPADINRWHGEVLYDFDAGLVTGPLYSWERCMRHDIAALATSDTVALLPGWQNSRGATVERQVASMLHIPAIHVDPDAGIVHRQVTIGISGRKRSGKDTVAEVLCRRHGFHRLAFADRLKAMLADINPMVRRDDGEVEHLQALLEREGGWEGAKSHTHARSLLQGAGDGVRAHLHPSALLDPVIHRLPPLAVISDVRLRSEAERIRADGGFMLRVHRPTDHIASTLEGDATTDSHLTETDLADFDFDAVIVNDATLDHLAEEASKVAAPLLQSATLYRRNPVAA